RFQLGEREQGHGADLAFCGGHSGALARSSASNTPACTSTAANEGLPLAAARLGLVAAEKAWDAGEPAHTASVMGPTGIREMEANRDELRPVERTGRPHCCHVRCNTGVGSESRALAGVQPDGC